MWVGALATLVSLFGGGRDNPTPADLIVMTVMLVTAAVATPHLAVRARCAGHDSGTSPGAFSDACTRSMISRQAHELHPAVAPCHHRPMDRPRHFGSQMSGQSRPSALAS
jgi:hypothetical protein